MNPTTLSVALVAAQRALNSFPYGVSLESLMELAAFRARLGKEYEAIRRRFLAPTFRATSCSDAALAAMLLNVGVFCLGRAFPPRQFGALKRMNEAGRYLANEKREKLVKGSCVVSPPETAARVFFLSNIPFSNNLLYPQVFFARHDVELEALQIKTPGELVKKLESFWIYRWTTEGSRYLLKSRQKARYLALKTLRAEIFFHAFWEYEGNDPPHKPVPFETILENVYFPERLARHFLNGYPKLFERRRGDSYALVQTDPAVVLFDDSPSEPFDDPGWTPYAPFEVARQSELIAQDEERDAATLLGMLKISGAREAPKGKRRLLFNLRSLQPSAVRYDAALFKMISKLPLRLSEGKLWSVERPRVFLPRVPSRTFAVLSDFRADERSTTERLAIAVAPVPMDERQTTRERARTFATPPTDFSYGSEPPGWSFGDFLRKMTAPESSPFRPDDDWTFQEGNFEAMIEDPKYQYSRRKSGWDGVPFSPSLAAGGGTDHPGAGAVGDYSTSYVEEPFDATVRATRIDEPEGWRYREPTLEAPVAATIPAAPVQDWIDMPNVAPHFHATVYARSADEDDRWVYKPPRTVFEFVDSPFPPSKDPRWAPELLTVAPNLAQIRCPELVAPAPTLAALKTESFVAFPREYRYRFRISPPYDVFVRTIPPAIDPDAVGKLIDRLVEDGCVMVYYSKMLERFRKPLAKVGIDDAARLRAAIRKARPQYETRDNFAALAGERGLDPYDLTLRQIENHVGDQKRASLDELEKALMIPRRMLREVLLSSPRFVPAGSRDSFAIVASQGKPEKPPKGGRVKLTKRQRRLAAAEFERKARLAAAARRVETRDESKPIEAEPIAEEPAPVSSQERPEVAAETTIETTVESLAPEGFVEPTAVATPDAPEPTASATREESSSEETPRIPDVAAPQSTPREALRRFVETLLSTGQTIVYYRTLLERNKKLAAALRGEEELTAALRELFPSFGYGASFFEPRRRSASEPEETKIRRSLLLAWGDVDQFKSDKLASRFCVPQHLIEKTLRRFPEDFNFEGKSRFSITERARRDAERLRATSARILRELKTALADDLAFLNYVAYFERNASWLADLGIDDVKLLRREMANLSKENALGYVFYRDYCERKPCSARRQTRIRRMILDAWGDAPRVDVDRLLDVVYAPRDEVEDALRGSCEFVYEGAGYYRKASEQNDAATVSPEDDRAQGSEAERLEEVASQTGEERVETPGESAISSEDAPSE